MPPKNPPHDALTRAINKAIAQGEPVIVEKPTPEVELFLLKAFNAELLAALKEAESIIDALWTNTHARSEYGWDNSDATSLELIRNTIAKASGVPQ